MRSRTNAGRGSEPTTEVGKSGSLDIEKQRKKIADER
jgi:hypothetical protein